MNRRQTKILACLTLASAAIASAQTLRPGDYEVTVDMQLPNSQTTTFTETTCLTPEGARDFSAFLQDSMNADEDCTHSNLKTAGNKTTWDTACDDSTSVSELTTLAGDTFTVVVTTKIGGETLKANMRAKRIDATCTAEDDDE